MSRIASRPIEEKNNKIVEAFKIQKHTFFFRLLLNRSVKQHIEKLKNASK